MAKIEFTPKGVCSSKIIVSCDENDVIKDVKFIEEYRGNQVPEGNTMGVSILCKGKTIDEVINKLEGIDCRNRKTSCPDQLAQALKELKKEKVK